MEKKTRRQQAPRLDRQPSPHAARHGVRVDLYLPRALHVLVDAQAEKLGLTRSAHIRKLLELALRIAKSSRDA